MHYDSAISCISFAKTGLNSFDTYGKTERREKSRVFELSRMSAKMKNDRTGTEALPDTSSRVISLGCAEEIECN